VKKFLNVFFLLSVLCIKAQASIDFVNYNGCLVMNDEKTQLVLNNVEKITGWSAFSIVKDFSQKPANTWREQYPDTFVVSKSLGLYPTNNLVISNSNAIATAPAGQGFSTLEKDEIVQTVRATSNAFLYCCKNSSNTLMYGVKNNSNAIIHAAVALSDGTVLAQDNSNAILYCCKSMSNALVYGLKNNSYALHKILDEIVPFESAFARNTSNAFVYCCKNTSNMLTGAFTVYDDHQVYLNNTTEQNFVFFKNGFTVNAHRALTLRTPIFISGAIDLVDFGVIQLQNDMHLGSNTCLINGGIIDGNGYSLVLSNSFVIPEDKQLHIVSDTIINGHGATLYLEPHARIVVDHGVTLTLKNMCVKNTRNNLINPFIRPTGHGACIALQDVELALAGDFVFRNGKLFIHNDVLVTGSSVFSYRSSQPSYICDNATFGFDKNTTFFFYPSTVDNNLITMQSEASSLYLDAATLQTTHTGMRLSRGALCLDNNVSMISYAQTLLSDLSSSPIASKKYSATVFGVALGEVLSVSWSPDGKYLAAGGQSPDNTFEVQVYSFDGTNLSTFPVSQKKYGTTVFSVTWSPDGKYLAIGGFEPLSGDQVQIYSFDGSNLSLSPIASRNYGSRVFSIAWSPDGNYLAVGGDEPVNGQEIQIYSFDRVSLAIIPIVGVNYGDRVYSVVWNPDGEHIAVGGSGPVSPHGQMEVYNFDTIGLTLKSRINYGGYVFAVSWSPDGRSLAVGGYDPVGVHGEFEIYAFDKTIKSLLVKSNFGLAVYSISWSPDGKYIAVGGREPSSSHDELVVYGFGNKLSKITSRDYGNYIYSVSWGPDWKNLVVGGYNPTSGNDIEVYRADYSLDTTHQGLHNCITLGDSSRSDGDLDVQILAGARVTITGKVLDDSCF